jgi:hypothetical protein
MTPEPPAFCRVLPESGVRRLLIWSDFKDALKGQLQHPERLRDSHRLPCSVHVVEAHAQTRNEALARLLFKDQKTTPCLTDMSPASTQQLGLTVELSSRLLAHRAKRVFYLTVESDPTVDFMPKTPPPEKTTAARETGAHRAPLQLPRERVPEGPLRVIPEQYTSGVILPITRDEVLYDMQVPRSRLHQWRDTFKQRAAFERWQQLLWGKNLEEQLWTVRPPKGMFHDERVRTWVNKTLEAAGYDKAVMAVEWEIFWRRHGQ